MLAEFYRSHCVGNNIEILYVSSDRDVPSFEEYFKKMPWLSIPPLNTAELKQQIANQLRISALPTLVVLDVQGNFVTDRAREEVSVAIGDAGKGEDLIQKWLSTEAVPISEASLSGSGPPSLLM